MLYDPKWEVKADPLSLDSLIGWLEKQPVDKTYDYTCNGHCLLAQYFSAAGYKGVEMYTRYFSHAAGAVELPPHFNDIAIGRGHWVTGRTFGAALIRARALR